MAGLVFYHSSMKAADKKATDLMVKLLLAGLAIYLIGSRLESAPYGQILSLRWHATAFLLPLFALLAAFNLWLDARIWQRVHFFIGDISLSKAFKTNFVCYALSFVTPVNSGELAGRYLMLGQREDRQKTIFLTFWSHFPRLIGKLMLGGTGVLLLIPEKAGVGLLLKSLLLLSWNCGVLGFYLYFIRIQQWLSQHGLRRWKLENHLLKDRPTLREKFQLLGLASVKYLTYNIQFMALLLLWGGFSIGGPELFLAVLAFFFVSSLVPSFPAADFLIKGAIALYVFRSFLPGEALLIQATLGIWLVNVALPALSGLVIISRNNIPAQIRKRVQPGSRYGL